MIDADPVQDLVYLKYLLVKHDAPIVKKIYQAHVATFLKYNADEMHGPRS